MVFNPVSRNKIVCKSFPEFKLAENSLNFVQQFKYLGHSIDNSMSDDADVDREIKKWFTRTNLLIRLLEDFSDVQLMSKRLSYSELIVCVFMT